MDVHFTEQLKEAGEFDLCPGVIKLIGQIVQDVNAMSQKAVSSTSSVRSQVFISKNTKNRLSHQGFTLIEILVVVSIIGLLFSVALPSFLNYIERSRVSEIMGMAKAVQRGVTEYYMSAGKMVEDADKASINLNPDQSEYIAAISFSTTTSTATVTYTLGNTDAVGDIAIVGSVSGNNFTWQCDTAATTVANKYLPPSCHH